MKIELDELELVYLDDNITIATTVEDIMNVAAWRILKPSATIPAPIEMVKKIGQGFLEIIGNSTKKVVEIDFAHNELIILRELAVSSFRTPSKEYGLELKKKVYKALLEEEIMKSDILLSDATEKFLGSIIRDAGENSPNPNEDTNTCGAGNRT